MNKMAGNSEDRVIHHGIDQCGQTFRGTFKSSEPKVRTTCILGGMANAVS
jgi:hypothetical protein